MVTHDTPNLLDSLETVEVVENDINLFADELEDHYNHAASCISTLGTLSSVGCICCMSTICSLLNEDVPTDGGAV